MPTIKAYNVIDIGKNSKYTTVQGGAGHFTFIEKGKRAKIFFGKGRFRFQNRAIKTNNKVVFRMKEYFGSQKLKDPKRSVPCPRLRHPKFV